MTKEFVTTFTVSDEELWKKCIANNQDGYGAAINRYANKWATMMEERIHDGKKLSDIAKELSHAADTYGITGFMYGCAVATLAKVLVHGEELRKWHNLDVQIGIGGEKSNEIGGVLNPALLCVGAK